MMQQTIIYAVITGILLILHIIAFLYWNRKIDFTSDTIKNNASYQAAYFSITDGMGKEHIYKRKKKLRESTKDKIQAVLSHYQEHYLDEAFQDILIHRQILTEDGKVPIRKTSDIGWTLYLYAMPTEPYHSKNSVTAVINTISQCAKSKRVPETVLVQVLERAFQSDVSPDYRPDLVNRMLERILEKQKQG